MEIVFVYVQILFLHIYDISCAAAIQIDAQILRFKNGKFSLRPTHTRAHIKKGNRQKYFICTRAYNIIRIELSKNATPPPSPNPPIEKEPFVYLNVCFYASCAPRRAAFEYLWSGYKKIQIHIPSYLLKS